MKNHHKLILALSITLSAFLSTPLTAFSKTGVQTINVPYHKFVLDNGLQVIFHIDKSDPIVSSTILYHVGSSREEKGKTGFAHLFEHLMFQKSENVGEDQFFKIIQNVGGTLNGFTTEDSTTYFEVAPNDALETLLWIESDRMGYFINTVTQESFENQQEVVQNEKRQRGDNQPYGHTFYLINKNIFPEGHPYNWQVIGSMKDLQNATVDDVKKFYKKYYAPNNATLVLSGDFDPIQAKKLVKKYYGEIKKGNFVKKPVPMNVTLAQTKKVFHEDNFAKLPELHMVWPSVQSYHKDYYALNYLADLLANGKKSPLYKVLVKDKKLTSDVSAYVNASEMAGTFMIKVRTFPDVNLTQVEEAIFQALEKFEKDGFQDKEIEAIKAKQETDFYNGISTVLDKSIKLADYNAYTGSPDFLQRDIENIKSVSRKDIIAVYNKYIKNKHFVETSFVPKGQTNLVVAGSEDYPVDEEKIIPASEKNSAVGEGLRPSRTEPSPTRPSRTKTPSAFDRSKEPATGKTPSLKIPDIQKFSLKNGMNVYNIEQKELPLVSFSMILNGGMSLENPGKIGVANLLAQMLTNKTKYKTPEELEEEINLLGATINIRAGKEGIYISGNTLSRNYQKTIALLQEILLSPGWDNKEFERIKEKTINNIRESSADPVQIAEKVFNKLLYGYENIFSNPVAGSVKSVESITLDDLKAYYNNYVSPSAANFHVVGYVDKKQIAQSLSGLEKSWPARTLNISEYSSPVKPDKSRIYFVDLPKAKQSVIRIGNLALKYNDKDYFPAYVMNYKLGGSFSSILNLILREEKGYTYGARSIISGSKIIGPFKAASSVKSNTTYDSVRIFKEEIEKYHNGISPEDLSFTKNYLIKSDALSFESYRELLEILENISNYNLPYNYVKKREKIINEMSLDKIKTLAGKYIQPDNMYYLVVGDAETQLEPLKKLGLGDPVKLDSEGNSVLK